MEGTGYDWLLNLFLFLSFFKLETESVLACRGGPVSLPLEYIKHMDMPRMSKYRLCDNTTPRFTCMTLNTQLKNEIK